MKRVIRFVNVIVVILIIVCLGTNTVWAPESLGGVVGSGKGDAGTGSMDSAYSKKSTTPKDRSSGPRMGAGDDGGNTGITGSGNISSSYGSSYADIEGSNPEQNSGGMEANQGGQANAADAENSSYSKYYMTYEELMALDNIDFWDKITGMAILSKLKKEDAEKLLELARGGITMKEFETASRLLEEALGKEDFKKLMDITEKNKKLLADNRKE
ncbi:hypothetical protein CDQ84_04185 [Clostridium thermosuccinogenes]|uniref:DUF4476 domain-containing protein n=1 Tax=Clostridium thermosuccinogenes TaxID=84032 RepID=A0A2K2FJI1_9CLOT|nr:hypothetical protein [Pseudoclostridium thermosuccinogenes]AUS98379.1 hypothetical protein CDO33_19120 [Pseudoclostridium thermosuccinogenes]PNT98941.1 hypothetical protein CDQ85_04140 [Pseudoclostridium thermosuccinogenes]PNU00856.1 hypothetical protein CDQ84_04185 [Pseudoclostridium thermosuccinogenes]